MSNQMQTLIFNEQNIETIILDGVKYITSTSIANALEYSNAKSISNLFNSNKEEFSESDYRVIDMMTVKNAPYKQLIFSLSGVVGLTMLARTQKARQFREWAKKTLIDNHIAPQIQLTQKEQVLLLARNLLQAEEENQALKLENTAKEQIITEFISIEGTKNYTECAKILHIAPQTFINWLKNNHYICRDRLPRQEYINRGYFVIKKTTNEVGRRCESYRITPKGFEYFCKKIVNKPVELNK